MTIPSNDNDETLWPLAPHTLGKHLVLRNYLNAWLPIMGKTNDRVLFIDGFAGPGRYTGGEEGSPVVALRTLLAHPFRPRLTNQLMFFFIEDRESRCRHLHDEITPIVKVLNEKGSKVFAEVRHGKFDQTMKEVLDRIDEQKKQLAPAFVMVDPFGVSDTPMHVLERILKNAKSELYVSVMWEFINRFAKGPEFHAHLDELFGRQDWRPLFNEPNWRIRKNAVFALYRAELKKRGATHVTHFELYEGATLKYAIFFATKHPLGCDRMKAAIWKVDPFGGHAFVPGASEETNLFADQALEPLKQLLRQRYGGKATKVDVMCEWLMTDETYFYSGQLKTVLRELEKANLLTVVDGTRLRKNTHPDGTIVTLTPL